MNKCVFYQETKLYLYIIIYLCTYTRINENACVSLSVTILCVNNILSLY